MQSSINVKGQARIRHSLQRAEARPKAADAATAKCARRDASHSDAFDHLVSLHSCTDSLKVMNARRRRHLKACGASDAHKIARQDIIADMNEHITLSTIDIAQCVGDGASVASAHVTVSRCKCVRRVAHRTPMIRVLMWSVFASCLLRIGSVFLVRRTRVVFPLNPSVSSFLARLVVTALQGVA